MISFTVWNKNVCHEVLIDDEDWAWVSLYDWRLSSHGYACRQDPDRGFVRLHREVLRVANPKIYVDHINGNRLDNRKENLRCATPQQNSANNGAKRTYNKAPRPSRYKGVSYRRGRYRLNIKLPDGTKIDRLFQDEVEAAREYDRLALLHYGQYARLNFPVHPGPAIPSESEEGSHPAPRGGAGSPDDSRPGVSS